MLPDGLFGEWDDSLVIMRLWCPEVETMHDLEILILLLLESRLSSCETLHRAPPHSHTIAHSTPSFNNVSTSILQFNLLNSDSLALSVCVYTHRI